VRISFLSPAPGADPYYGRTYAEGKKITWRDGAKAVWVLMRIRLAGR
jgi:hypothetical protein